MSPGQPETGRSYICLRPPPSFTSLGRLREARIAEQLGPDTVADYDIYEAVILLAPIKGQLTLLRPMQCEARC